MTFSRRRFAPSADHRSGRQLAVSSSGVSRSLSRLAVAAAIPLLALTLAACNSGGAEANDGVATAGKPSEAKPGAKAGTSKGLHEFAQCMRDAGINMPDPKNEKDLQIPREARGNKAASKCYPLLPDSPPVKPDPEANKRMLELARCMRANGVPEMVDPNPEGMTVYPTPIDENTPRYKAAAKICGAIESQPAG